MPRELKAYCEDIRSSVARIKRYAFSLSKDDLKNNQLVLDAVIRNLEVIGEAVKKIPEEIRVMYPNIPWRNRAHLIKVMCPWGQLLFISHHHGRFKNL